MAQDKNQSKTLELMFILLLQFNIVMVYNGLVISYQVLRWVICLDGSFHVIPLHEDGDVIVAAGN